jgi:tRNA(adenine34) deaminase
MCAGAIFWTQLQRVVFGAPDEKRGCSNVGVPLFHPKTTLTSGVMEEECGQLMKAFFAGKR